MLTATDLDSLPLALVVPMWATFALGGFLCLFNGHLFVRYYWRRRCNIPLDKSDRISPLPILGSLLVYLMLRSLGENPVVLAIGIFLIAVDTGGIPWIILSICIQAIRALVRRIRSR